ncbi:MAG: aminopeptidase P family N-terminal domain-containing protein, partial [Pseudomonadota bacterium]
MFQSFAPTTSPKTGAARLAALRETMTAEGLDGFMVPRADAHQGENVAPRDERLAWLTGFTGSAGFCIALQGTAGVFVDGRYTLQVRNQVDLAQFTPVDMIDVAAEKWLEEAQPAGGVIGYDPWLHGTAEIERLEKALKDKGFTFRPGANLIDRIWEDQPEPPQAQAWVHPADIAGRDHTTKRMDIAEALASRGADAALLSLPDSIAWLLNIRGGDIPRTPVAHGFALLHRDGTVTLYGLEAKLGPDVLAHLGNAVTVSPLSELDGDLSALAGKTVSVDRRTAPVRLTRLLRDAGARTDWHEPCALPKARKTDAELDGTRAAHLRDGAAMAQFLHWIDETVGDGGLTEIDVVTELESIRGRSGALKDISFETICGSGPN